MRRWLDLPLRKARPRGPNSLQEALLVQGEEDVVGNVLWPHQFILERACRKQACAERRRGRQAARVGRSALPMAASFIASSGCSMFGIMMPAGPAPDQGIHGRICTPCLARLRCATWSVGHIDRGVLVHLHRLLHGASDARVGPRRGTFGCAATSGQPRSPTEGASEAGVACLG